MRRLLWGILAAATIAGPALAADLQGKWQFQRQGFNGTYFGVMVINQRREVRLKGTSPSQNYWECGYVQDKGNKIDVVFTLAKGDRGYNADHFYCQLGQDRSLSCLNIDVAGSTSGTSFTLTRVSDLPETPAERLEDVCPPGQIPRS